MATIKFKTTLPTLREASILFRRVVGDVNSLRDSLLGNNPACMDATTFDARRHRDIRKFSDEDTLRGFTQYLGELVEKLPDPRPTITSNDGVLIEYTVASGRASIRIVKNADGWTVSGYAMYQDPSIAAKILKAHGLQLDVNLATMSRPRWTKKDQI